MTTELVALLTTGFMTFLTIFIQLNYSSMAHGMAHSMSSRDVAVKETKMGGRLRRAAVNNVEAVAMFAPLVIIAQLADISNDWTVYASYAFIASRILYVPSYLLGLVPIRSMVWMLGFFAIPFFIYGLFA
jgi:uncharacterized MAPEG superfamily protein